MKVLESLGLESGVKSLSALNPELLTHNCLMTDFSLQILSPEKVVYEGNVVSLVAPGQEGYLGVMAHHAPMLAALTVGEFKITAADGKVAYFAISGGMLEVEKNKVVVYADAAEGAEEIDVRRAEEAKIRAIGRLSQQTAEIDMARAQAALMRAMNRLHIAVRKGRG